MISLVVNGFTAKWAVAVTRLVQEIQSHFTFETHAEEFIFGPVFSAKSWLIFNIPCTYLGSRISLIILFLTLSPSLAKAMPRAL